MVFIAPYAPTKLIVHDSYTTDTAWHVVATDGTGYTSVQALLNAGKTRFPGLAPGAMLQTLLVRSDDGSGTGIDGSAFYISFDKATQPADTETAELISGSGQGVPFAGHIWNVWIKKIVATDDIILVGAY